MLITFFKFVVIQLVGELNIFNPYGFTQVQRFVQACWQPDLNVDLLILTWKATWLTLAYAVCGTSISLVFGVLGGLVCSEVFWYAVFQFSSSTHVFRDKRLLCEPFAGSLFELMRLSLAVPRAIHELVWGLLFVNIWGTDALTGILAIAIPFSAITAKVFSDILDETPREPLMVLLNSGVAPLSAFFYGLLPQALLNLISYACYRFECSIRSATVLGIVGAGGLGYQLMLSLSSLRFEEVWTFIYALWGLCGLVDICSAGLRRKLGCASRLDLNASRFNRGRFNQTFRSMPLLEPEDHQASSFSVMVLIAALIGAVGAAFWFIDADFSKLGSAQTSRFLGELAKLSVSPDLSILGQLGVLSVQTVIMSIFAIAIAGLGGMLLSFCAAQNLVLPGGLFNPTSRGFVSRLYGWSVLLVVRAILLLCRAVPAPVWALVVLYVIFPGILPGAIALGIHNLGILGRLKAEVVENLDERPLEALKAQGASAPLIFSYGILPLTFSRFLAYDLYRWEVCMRETAIVGIVGAGGLGYLMNEQLSNFDYRGLFTTLGCFVGLTFIVDWSSTLVRRLLR